MKNKNYFAPEACELQVSTEGILCASVTGAGVLNDNSWDLTFGEGETN